MFTIIGGDGKEYGPVSTDQIHAWIKEGRANPDKTFARLDGTAELKLLRDFPEFSGAAIPPPLASMTPAGVVTSNYEPAAAASTLPLASRGMRFLCAFLDGVVMCLCSIPAWIFYANHILKPMIEAMESGEKPAFDPATFLPFYGYYFACLLIYTVIQVAFIALRGQSLAKCLLGLRVVMVAGETKPTFVQGVLMRAIVPSVIGFIPLFGALFWLVDACFIFGDQKRCVHDLIAGTKVVTKRSS